MDGQPVDAGKWSVWATNLTNGELERPVTDGTKEECEKFITENDPNGLHGFKLVEGDGWDQVEDVVTFTGILIIGDEDEDDEYEDYSDTIYGGWGSGWDDDVDDDGDWQNDPDGDEWDE